MIRSSKTRSITHFIACCNVLLEVFGIYVVNIDVNNDVSHQDLVISLLCEILKE